MRVTALVPIGFAAGAVLCGALLRHAPASIAVDLAQPLPVVTYWQQFGGAMWASLFLAIAIAAAGYIAALRSAPALRITMAASGIACAAALAFPVVFSSDVYAYAGYGDLSLHGIDPYAHAAIALRDPLLDAMQWQWGNQPPMCVYGPAFVWLTRAIVAAFLPLGPAAPLWALRIMSCIALVACAPLAYAAFARFPQKQRLCAASGIALNPIAIWSCAEGHNDVLLIAIVLAGFALLQRGRAFAGALMIALSALVKAPGLIAAIGLTLASWPDRLRFPRILAGAASGAAIVAAIAVPLEYGVRAHLAPGGHYFPQFSVQALLAFAMPLPLATALTFASCAVLFVRGALRMLVGNVDGALTMALAVWFALPNPYPWYALWILPLAFLVWNSQAAWAIVAATLLIVLRYYGDATTDLSHGSTAAIVLLQFGIPLVLFSVRRTNRSRPDHREIRTSAPDFAPLRSE